MLLERRSRAIDVLLEKRDVRMLYQPIVVLATGAVAGFEALARGPEGSELERPDLMFAAAREHGRLAELDWLCRSSAFAEALDAPPHAPYALFVNGEPEVLDSPTPAADRPLERRARDELAVVHEITERGLAARPAEMLAAVERLRGDGWAIAVDDVGADWHSLALLPFIRPEVVKLDMSIVREPLDRERGRIAAAVLAYASWAGARVLAEGLETRAQVDRAVAGGATLGQGWFFGRPAPMQLPDGGKGHGQSLVSGQPKIELGTPFEIASRALSMEVASKETLLSISMKMEASARVMEESSVLLGCFQTPERFTPATRARYSALGERSAFVGAFGEGLRERPAPYVRGASFADNDALRDEWNVLKVSPHSASALIARDLGDDGPDLERRFSFAVTHDRDLVVRAARALMLKITALARS
jgi:EAL domain-containing protein (putative c-di-GMP-specific phosphodiesterase class I)